MLKKLTKNKAFSIVEVLVVVFILVALTTIGVANYNKGRDIRILNGSAQKVASVLREARTMPQTGQMFEGLGDGGDLARPQNGLGVYIQSSSKYLLFANQKEDGDDFDYNNEIDVDIREYELPDGVVFSSENLRKSYVFGRDRSIYFEGDGCITVGLSKDESLFRSVAIFEDTGRIDLTEECGAFVPGEELDPVDPLVPAPVTDDSEVCWGSDSWAHRKKITIDSQKIDEDLVDFPVLVKITDKDLFKRMKADLLDIRFIFGDESPQVLDYEIANLVYPQEAIIWVKIPSVSSSVSTEFYMYYGNEFATDDQNVSDVWSNEYYFNLHLSEINDNFPFMDSTSDNTPIKSGTVYYDETSAISSFGAIRFDKSGYIEVPMSRGKSSLESGTYSFWTKRIDPGLLSGAFVTIDNNWNPQEDFMNSSANISDFRCRGRYPNGSVGTANKTLDNQTWYHVACVFDYYGDGQVEVSTYIDGVLYDSVIGENREEYQYAASVVRIGAEKHVNADMDRRYRGVIDEFSYSKTARSSAWIKAQYNSETNNLLTLGGEELCGADLWENPDWSCWEDASNEETCIGRYRYYKIHAGTIINEPGKYALVKDVLGRIKIKASNVEIDCQGHELFSSGTGVIVECDEGSSCNDLEIKNCNIRGGQSGIVIQGRSDSLINNVKLYNNTIKDSTTDGGSGISLQHVSTYEIAGNTLDGSDGSNWSHLIYLLNTRSGLVYNNSIVSNYTAISLGGISCNNISGSNYCDPNSDVSSGSCTETNNLNLNCSSE